MNHLNSLAIVFKTIVVATCFICLASAASSAKLGADRAPVLTTNPAGNTDAVCIARQALVCVNAEDGRHLWSVPLLGDGSAFYLDDGALIIADNHQLSRYQPRTGVLQWQKTFPVPIFLPVVDSSGLYISGEQGLVARLDMRSGDVIWQRSITSSWQYSATSDGQPLLLVGQDHLLRVLSKKTGATLLEAPLGQEPVFRPLMSGSDLIVSTFANQTLALNARSGQIRWQVDTIAPVFFSEKRGNQLVEASMNGAITVRDLETGKMLWTQQPFSTPSFTVTASSEVVAVMNQNGRLFAYDMKTGEHLALSFEQVRVSGSNFAPILRNKQLLLLASSGQIRRVPLSVKKVSRRLSLVNSSILAQTIKSI